MNRLIGCEGRSEYAKNIVEAAGLVENSAELKNAHVLITGATGMIGAALCRTLIYLNRENNLNLKLILPVRSEQSLERLGSVAGCPEVRAFVCDLTKEIELKEPIDYIIHAASPTESAFLKTRGDEVIAFNVLSTLNLLKLAVQNNIKGMVYLSSMEVYGSSEGKVSEDAPCQIDLSDTRSSYAESKRLCENVCACYAKRYDLKICSARLAQVIGAGVKAGENRAYAYFARQALKGEDIILKTDGSSRGNYLHISDAVSAICFLLTKGEAGQSYNLCSEGGHATIKELAQRISDLLSNGKSRVVCDIPPDTSALPFAPKTGITLDTTKISALGWRSRYGLNDMILSLAKDITELEQN